MTVFMCIKESQRQIFQVVHKLYTERCRIIVSIENFVYLRLKLFPETSAFTFILNRPNPVKTSRF